MSENDDNINTPFKVTNSCVTRQPQIISVACFFIKYVLCINNSFSFNLIYDIVVTCFIGHDKSLIYTYCF